VSLDLPAPECPESRSSIIVESFLVRVIAERERRLTQELSDAGPKMPELKPARPPGIRWSDFVSRSVHCLEA
jgi:hypothetical protein